jgi:hypothetical protein
VRLRWRYHELEGETRRADVTFLRIPPGDPTLPGEETSSDKAFGLVDGYYLPGPGNLGRRRLQPSDEMRAHYVFHSPGGWF